MDGKDLIEKKIQTIHSEAWSMDTDQTESLSKETIMELIGVCSGITADNIVNLQEAKFLVSWMEENLDNINDTTTSLIYQRIQYMLEDDYLDEDEQVELFELLRSLSHDKKQPFKDSELDQLLNTPDFDKPEEIYFLGREFCFTGYFASNSRKHYQTKVKDKHGKIKSSARRSLDYLVIGDANPVINGTRMYSTKARDALFYREENSTPLIITESTLADALTKTDPAKQTIDPQESKGTYIINYISASGAKTERKIQIHSITSLKYNRVHIEGFCELRNAIRTFLPDRVQDPIINTATGEEITIAELLQQHGIKNTTEAEDRLKQEEVKNKVPQWKKKRLNLPGTYIEMYPDLPPKLCIIKKLLQAEIPRLITKGWCIHHRPGYIGLTGYEHDTFEYVIPVESRSNDKYYEVFTGKKDGKKIQKTRVYRPRDKIIINICQIRHLEKPEEEVWEVKTFWTNQRNLFTDPHEAIKLFLSIESRYDPGLIIWSKLENYYEFEKY